ncbi:MAG TPA: ABC transporter permease [Pyrinomonadaceae bacterium]|nr:ABC transporter permease [Pyrinomonadaceae bacterium]
MPLLPRLSSLWRNLLHKDRVEQELSEEVSAYLEMLIEAKVREGLKSEEARRAALIELGGVEQVKESVREIRMGQKLETMWQDLRYGGRMLFKNPGFTFVAVVTLALGIGANTAIFSIVDAALLKMLPVKEPERLVLFKSLAREDFSYGAYNADRRTDLATGLQAGTVFPNQSFARMRAQAQTQGSPCAELFAFGVTGANVTIDGQAESLRGLVVSGNYYAGLGVQPLLGRVITDDDDKAGASPVVVFSHRYWERRLNSDPAVIGKQISINNVAFTVIGVTPRGFDGTGEVGSAPEVFVPIAMEPQINPERRRTVGAGWWWLRLMGRLKPGATTEQVRAQLETVFQQSVVEHRSARQAQPLTDGRRPLPNLEPEDYPRLAVDSGSQGELNVRQSFAPQLYLLFGVVGLVLLIACANVANLLLARAAARQKEIAVRLALGAGRFRLIRQLLTESALLAMLGAGFGVLFALWIKDVMLSVSEWGGAEMAALNPQLDLRVLGFTFLLSLVTGILFGLAPAWRATRVDLTPALKDTGRNSSGMSRSWLSRGLVITQVALSFLLLVGAGLMLRTLHNLQNTDAGFNRENLLLFSVAPGQLGYRDGRLANLYRQLFARLDAVPGARGVTCSSEPLLSTSWYSRGVFAAGAPVANNSDNQPVENGEALFLGVRENFLETMGIPLLQGRTLRPQDDEQSPRVAVVNQAFAKQFFPNENPIGKRFGFDASDANQIEIVGLSADAKYTSLRDEIKPTIYLPWSQELQAVRSMAFEMRAAGKPGALAALVREAVRSVESNLPVFDVKTQIEQSDETLRTERLFARLLSFFGALALLLTGIGLYGVLAYAVAQRTQEIGIRMALGAQVRDVLLLVVRQAIGWTLIGVMLSMAVALWVTRWLESMLYGVSTTDPLTYAMIAVLLTLVALLACWIPARRATKVDPLVALRCE